MMPRIFSRRSPWCWPNTSSPLPRWPTGTAAAGPGSGSRRRPPVAALSSVRNAPQQRQAEFRKVGPRRRMCDKKGVASDNRDPIAAARANWERSGWGDVSLGMVAVTSVMRAHQILLARVETALRPMT